MVEPNEVMSYNDLPVYPQCRPLEGFAALLAASYTMHGVYQRVE